MLNLWSSLTILKHHYPLPDTVTVRVEALEGEDGEWSFDETDGHLIIISNTVAQDAMDEILCHEYSHAVCHYYPGPAEDAVWGVCYAELYRLLFGEH